MSEARKIKSLLMKKFPDSIFYAKTLTRKDIYGKIQKGLHIRCEKGFIFNNVIRYLKRMGIRKFSTHHTICGDKIIDFSVLIRIEEFKN